MAKITRRSFLGTGGAATGFAAANIAKGLGLPEIGADEPSGQRPMNVLFLMADQHRQHALGVDGDPAAKTPNLDDLARTSVRFDSAYCTDPLCVPSRASLLTGLYVHNHQASGNATPWPFEHKTIAHHFSAAGYMTGLIGKMHFVDAQTHGFDYHLDFNDWFQYLGPKTQRFAEALGDPNSGDGLPQIPSLWQGEGDPWTGHFERDDRQGLISVGRISSLAEEDHFESFVTRESIRFLKNNGKKRPFFLMSSFLKPHDPFMPAERFAKMFHAHEMTLPSTWGKVDLSTVPRQIRESIEYFWICPEVHDPEQAKLYMAMYYANLAQMDDNVGKILRALYELGLDENTIVVYTSDHGEMLGAHGLWQKMVFYEPSIGVPLMFRVPGVTAGNVRCTTPASLVQVLPTLTELCGISTPPGLDGTSLVTNLRYPARPMDTTIFAENDLNTPNAGFMIRQGDYKYCYYVNDTPELYDLSSDPQEMRNLALLPQFKEKSEEMRKRLFEWHQPTKG
jgi:choline-sulfatase